MGLDVITVKDVIDRKAGFNSVSDEQIINYAIENKNIIVTKDNGLKFRCFNESIPCIDLGSPEQEAKIVDTKLREMLAWKDYL
jgi:predicted nuclease of predicted toxin-antitoxin system